MNIRSFFRVPVLSVTLFIFSSAGIASAEDSFIQGYGTAVLVREFGVPPESLLVENGVVTLNTDHIKPEDLSEVVSILMGIQGVARVEIVGTESHEAEGVAASIPATSDDSGKPEQAPSDAPEQMTARHESERIFEPLMADPRWPRIAISYQLFTDNGDLNNLLASAIGGTIPVYRDDRHVTGRSQVAVQAAAFAINDLDTSSWDLLNSDYRFGLAFMNQRGPVSSIFRIYHFSTHAGDEAILNSGAERDNPREWLRVYGGSAYLFSRHPKELDPWAFQYGVELKSSRQYLKILRPVAGVNLYHTEENNWHSELSVRLGAEIENQTTQWHKVQFLLGYSNGPSAFGQFNDQSHEFLDIGMHFYY
jgi:hypothetical protein